MINIFTLGGNNFGDSVNKLFWEIIIEEKIYNNKNDYHYITTGSIMNLVNEKSIVFGTGFISKTGDIGGDFWGKGTNNKYKIPYKIIAVRGPLTRQKLLNFNINCPENYGDPLILMPCIYDISTNIKNDVIGIIPHYIDKNNNNYKILKKNLELEGYIVKYIDIRVGENYKKLIDSINNCKYIISSSLHGMMMGIVYKKKTIFIEFGNKVIGDGFKFQDFFGSININYINMNTYDKSVIDNVIDVNYNILIDKGVNLINLIPFIDKNRKEDLIKKYINFYNYNLLK